MSLSIPYVVVVTLTLVCECVCGSSGTLFTSSRRDDAFLFFSSPAGGPTEQPMLGGGVRKTFDTDPTTSGAGGPRRRSHQSQHSHHSLTQSQLTSLTTSQPSPRSLISIFNSIYIRNSSQVRKILSTTHKRTLLGNWNFKENLDDVNEI
jgi:hypothetical protein